MGEGREDEGEGRHEVRMMKGKEDEVRRRHEVRMGGMR